MLELFHGISLGCAGSKLYVNMGGSDNVVHVNLLNLCGSLDPHPR